MLQALRFLIDTFFGLITYAFLARFMMQALRAPFRNPVGPAVMALVMRGDDAHLRDFQRFDICFELRDAVAECRVLD